MNNYYYQNTDIIKRLEQALTIETSVIPIDNESALRDLDDYDFIINASDPYLNSSIPVVHVSPFLNSKDIDIINQFQKKLDSSSKIKETKSLFENFFNLELFEKNHYEPNPEAMICYMSDKLSSKGLTTEDFKQAVLDREAVTSTGFDNRVAIPHSIVISSFKNCAYVIINNIPMRWGYFDVNIIILIGIDHSKRNQFKEIYTNLLEKMYDPNTINRLIQCNNYSEFINILLRL